MSQAEIIFITLLIAAQIFVFLKVWKQINQLKNFFPASFQDVKVKKFFIPKTLLRDNQAFDSFINELDDEHNDFSDASFSKSIEHEPVELLVIPNELKESHGSFSRVVISTNAYLSKNKGASADFNILQDICERNLQKIDNTIGNQINVPLYIGLAGTFLGVIIGLRGIEFSNSVNSISPESIQLLLNGVILAMVASLIGLVFTVVNTAVFYKPAAYKSDTDKNHYYDFLQRELLPVLNIGMAGSLTNFKSVLSHFIQKFGDNMDEYKDSAQLLNDNLHSQQLVLEEINRLSLTKTSVEIARTFSDLRESSEHLQSFREYQAGLNDNIVQTSKVVKDISELVGQFKDFNTNLRSISGNVHSSIELQKQFKDSLETHFPTIEDHRVLWRQHIDELNQDVKSVYMQLNDYFSKSTDLINSFIGNNDNFFSGVNDTQNTMKLFIKQAELQNQQFMELKAEMTQMRMESHQSQNASLDLQRELIEAMKQFNKNIAKIELSKPVEV